MNENKSSRIYGTPGASLENSPFSESNIKSGIEGETRVAQNLAKIAKNINNMYVFNSVKLPKSNGDIDHVVVLGNNVFLVDSKNWQSNCTYSIGSETDEETIIKRNNKDFLGNEVHMNRQMRKWKEHFPNANVYGILCISRYDTAISNQPEHFNFFNINELCNFFSKFEKNTYGVQFDLVENMKSLVQYDSKYKDFEDIFNGKSIPVQTVYKEADQTKNDNPVSRTQDYILTWAVINVVLIFFMTNIVTISMIVNLVLSIIKFRENKHYKYLIAIIIQSVFLFFLLITNL